MKSCMDDYDPNSLPLEIATTRILDSISALESYVKIALRDSLSRVLATDIKSTINVPAFNNSAMDGYAVNGSDLPLTGSQTLKIVGKVMAGSPYIGEIQKGQCARIMTGGKMPDGTDTVIMQEHVKVRDDHIEIDNRQHAGQNVRLLGEDLTQGETVLHAGRFLTSADIGLLASLGIPEILVIRNLRVAFFTTGDELRSLGEQLASGQIYDSNRYTLHSMLSRLGVDILDMGIVGDDPEKIRAALKLASSQADVLITSGGVSVGEADFVKETLESLGEISFWKIAMKPGRPLAYGTIGACHFFGLPGNPVSAMVTFYQLVLPALYKLSGRTDFSPLILSVECRSNLKKSPGRVEFQRGILKNDDDGNLVVYTTGQQGSGILKSMSTANCFIVLPMECSKIDIGTIVNVQPFSGLI